jgi:hypothetical protein
VRPRVRAALPQGRGAVLTVSTRKLDPGRRRTPEPGPRWGQRCRVQSWRPRLTTVCGRVKWERPWYVCRRCRQGWSPVDRTWAVAPRTRLSEGREEWLAWVGAATDFAEAPEWLEQLTGSRGAKATVRPRAERQGGPASRSSSRRWCRSSGRGKVCPRSKRRRGNCWWRPLGCWCATGTRAGTQ